MVGLTFGISGEANAMVVKTVIRARERKKPSPTPQNNVPNINLVENTRLGLVSIVITG